MWGGKDANIPGTGTPTELRPTTRLNIVAAKSVKHARVTRMM